MFTLGWILSIQPVQCVRVVEPSLDWMRTGLKGVSLPDSGLPPYSGEKRLSLLFSTSVSSESSAVSW